MYALVRPILFSLRPDTAHALGMAALAPIEHFGPLRSVVRALCTVKDPRLVTRVMGLEFPNPLGVAGGFDKNAHRPRALAALGFGFLELGTVTASPQEANPAPNLFRLEKDRALVNRLGFPNEGAALVAARLAKKRHGLRLDGAPVGLSIGKSRKVAVEPIDGAITDYLESFREAKRVADFVVVNVSSPNTKDLRAMQGAELARLLLAAITRENSLSMKVPVLVKIAPDLSDAELEALLGVVEECGLDGVVATNTTLSRANLATSASEVEAIGAGGLSGPPLRKRALDVIRRVRARLGPKTAVIGVGGVETAEHVLDLLRAGADLVQMYTGFIYGGPGTPRAIVRDILAQVERAGAASLRELVDGNTQIGDAPGPFRL